MSKPSSHENAILRIARLSDELLDKGEEAGDLGLIQIQRGYAWYFVRYKKDISEAQQQRYAEAERSARNARLGLWAGIDASVRNPALMPEPPWKFRERTRKEK